MKKILLHLFLFSGILIVLSNCMRPVDSDFGEGNEGLRDNELLWIIRIPAQTNITGKETLSKNDSIQIEKWNRPLFESAMQNIIKDVLNEKLPVYEDFALTTDLQKVENINERLGQLKGTKFDYGPLNQVLELYAILTSENGRYQSRLSFLRLVWRDPEGLQADRYFGGIRMKDLEKQRYKIYFRGDSILLGDYFQKENYFFLPVYLRTNSREYNLQSSQEAKFLRTKVQSGNYDLIDWVEDGINISGKKRISLGTTTLIQLAGPYQFKQFDIRDSSEHILDLFLTAENDYLIVDWSHRFRMEKILPFQDSAFFSPRGDLYFFEMDADSTLSLSYVRENDTLIGWKKQ